MFLLDTNIVSHFFRQNKTVTQKIISTNPNLILSCSIVANELLFGAYKNPLKTDILLKFYNDFFQKVEIIDYDLQAARTFATIKNNTIKNGRPVEDFDLMIASICLVNDLILVTNNIKHFGLIENLKLEDWTV